MVEESVSVKSASPAPSPGKAARLRTLQSMDQQANLSGLELREVRQAEMDQSADFVFSPPEPASTVAYSVRYVEEEMVEKFAFAKPDSAGTSPDSKKTIPDKVKYQPDDTDEAKAKSDRTKRDTSSKTREFDFNLVTVLLHAHFSGLPDLQCCLVNPTSVFQQEKVSQVTIVV